MISHYKEVSTADELIHEINNAQTIIGCACRKLTKHMTLDEAYPFITIIKFQLERIEMAYKEYMSNTMTAV